jgi:organic radical activating enzyme
MIHAGLNINLNARTNSLSFNQCCLSTTELQMPADSRLIWNSPDFVSNRKINNENVWLEGCWECQHLENAGLKSFRQSMIEGLGVEQNVTGPKRIDLLFDRSCNLACRTCGSHSSTFWEKHLRDNNLPTETDSTPTQNFATVKKMLESLDLSNLQQVQFCGGETLMGNTYWNTAELIADLVPDAKDKILLGFQTNGTQPIEEKYYKIIEQFRLVKFMISIDGTHDQFEYLRWPANWNQVVDNIMTIREKVPGNVMFYIQETTSCLNLLHFGEVGAWVAQNFSNNRFGDPTDHSTQLAIHDYLDVNNITQEYRDALEGTKMSEFISPDWQENPDRIQRFLQETQRFDSIRGQDWKMTFPEVANFYSRYLNK